MSVTADRHAAPAAGAIALFATLVAGYLVSQFLRNSVGVLAPDIAAEMHIAASEIGVLSSAFFFAFAAVQLPLGVALDRFGPKRCMLVCTAIVIASALLFAGGRTPAELVAARVVMGVGTLGTLLATAPLAYAAAGIGWRASFVAVAAVMGAVGLLLALVVHEPSRAAKGAKVRAGERRLSARRLSAGVRAAGGFSRRRDRALPDGARSLARSAPPRRPVVTGPAGRPPQVTGKIKLFLSVDRELFVGASSCILCGAVADCCGAATRAIVLLPPSLGVSSLDLGR
jgi:predicted MFS family arabinose efflux permease